MNESIENIAASMRDKIGSPDTIIELQPEKNERSPTYSDYICNYQRFLILLCPRLKLIWFLKLKQSNGNILGY